MLFELHQDKTFFNQLLRFLQLWYHRQIVQHRY